MHEAHSTGSVAGVDTREVARNAVTSPANLASFGERGFRTVISGRVVDYLVLKAGIDRAAATVAARKAIEEVGGLVVGSRIREDLPDRVAPLAAAERSLDDPRDRRRRRPAVLHPAAAGSLTEAP